MVDVDLRGRSDHRSVVNGNVGGSGRGRQGRHACGFGFGRGGFPGAVRLAFSVGVSPAKTRDRPKSFGFLISGGPRDRSQAGLHLLAVRCWPNRYSAWGPAGVGAGFSVAEGAGACSFYCFFDRVMFWAARCGRRPLGPGGAAVKRGSRRIGESAPGAGPAPQKSPGCRAKKAPRREHQRPLAPWRRRRPAPAHPSPPPRDQRVNFLYLMRLGSTASGPSRRFLSSS